MKLVEKVQLFSRCKKLKEPTADFFNNNIKLKQN